MLIARKANGLARTDLDAQLAQTHHGQAHFATTGPADATCRECRWWAHAKQKWHPVVHGGKLKDSRCIKFRRLTGRRGKPVPHDAAACSHFQPGEHVPEVVKPPHRSQLAKDGSGLAKDGG